MLETEIWIFISFESKRKFMDFVLHLVLKYQSYQFKKS